eukprot:7405203-Pyramimonas_sp.AAC.1
MQELRVYSRTAPIGHRKRGYIRMPHQSDTGSAERYACAYVCACPREPPALCGCSYAKPLRFGHPRADRWPSDGRSGC